MPKRVFVTGVLLVLLVAVATLTAGSGLARPASSSTLRVAVWSDWSFIKQAATEFEKQNPGVTVKIDAIPGGGYFNALPQTLASSSVPDVTVLQSIPGPYTTVIKSHLLVPLDDVWTAQHLGATYAKSAAAQYTAADGHHYAINVGLGWVPVVYYNKTAFAKAHVTAPVGRVKSLADWYRITDALKSAGYVPVSPYGISDEYGAAFIFSQLLQSACKSGYDNLLNNWQHKLPVKVKWNSPCVMKSMQLLTDFASRDMFGVSPATLSHQAATTLFDSGKAATFISGQWAVPFKETFKTGWFLWPPVDGGAPTKFLLANQDALGIPTKSKNILLAKKFLELVASKKFESEQSFFGTGRIPPRTDVVIPKGTATDLVNMYHSIPKLGSSAMLTIAVPYQSQIPPLLTSLLAGQKTPSQIAVILNKALTKARATS